MSNEIHIYSHSRVKTGQKTVAAIAFVVSDSYI